ncbi:MAG TPA: pentapeptide repeat-containing protein [Candidatus Baltobacteraceae bacterium]|jgi:hypothetical protein
MPDLQDTSKSKVWDFGAVVLGLCALFIVGAFCALVIVNGLTASHVTTTIVDAKTTPSPSPHPAALADLSAFEARPDAAHWTPLHQDFVVGPFTPIMGSRLVNVLVSRDLPRPLVNAVAEDLSSFDEGNAIHDLRLINIASRVDGDPGTAAEVRRSSLFIWLILALRSSYDSGGVDLTRTDLRTGGNFVGQGMNLQSVDFTGAMMGGGEWHGSNLTFAQFTGVQLEKPLTCTGCSWGNIRVAGRAKLADNGWVLP